MLKMHIRDQVIYNYFNDCYWRGVHFFWLNKSVPFWSLWNNFIRLLFLPDDLGDLFSTENWNQFYQGFCILVLKYLVSRWKGKENFWFIDLQLCQIREIQEVVGSEEGLQTRGNCGRGNLAPLRRHLHHPSLCRCAEAASACSWCLRARISSQLQLQWHHGVNWNRW